MQDVDFNNSHPRTGRGSLIVSVICLVLNFLIGPTILANVILLMISFFSAVSAFFPALIAMFRADPRNRPTGVLIGSIIVVAIIIGLVATDNVPAGYGP